MLHRSSSRDSGLANGTSYMSTRQMSDYLQDLRSNKPIRPQGSRPLPASMKRRSHNFESVKENRLSMSNDPESYDLPSRSSSALSHRHSYSISGRASPERLTYAERESRRKEKEEARAMRAAMQFHGDEELVNAAAQAEAEHLVEKHRYPNLPYHVSRASKSSIARRSRYSMDKSLDYGDILDQYRDSAEVSRQSLDATSTAEQGAMQDAGQPSQTLEQLEQEMSQIEPTNKSDEAHDHDVKGMRRISQRLSLSRLSSHRRSSAVPRKVSDSKKAAFPNETEKIYEDPPAPTRSRPSAIPDRASDQPSWISRNPFARAQALRQSLSRKTGQAVSRAMVTKGEDVKAPDGRASSSKENVRDTEILENGTRYRNGVEVRSDEIRAATSMRMSERSPRLPSPIIVSDSPERPIVSFEGDWKSTQRKSSGPTQAYPNLAAAYPGQETFSRPTSSSSSRDREQANSAPRSIQYSTTSGWRNDRPSSRTGPPLPSISVSEPSSRDHRSKAASLSHRSIGSNATPQPENPAVPSISVSDISAATSQPIPVICLPDDSPADHVSSTSPKADETPGASKSQASKSWVGDAVVPTKPSIARPSWSTNRQLLCAQCALPITGRVVSAAGTRFHPNCFTCYTCNTPLECMAFLPEPASVRTSRLDRIASRQSGIDVPVPKDACVHSDPQVALDADNDDSLRFYCQLDYHEHFSPRCSHCHTPIEGETILACGRQYHAGHFFCAQCGDPFTPDIPFVERDGYAWCVGCNAQRTSAKCAKCKKPVVDYVVKALGGEWHDECFRCVECQGSFQDGRFFVRGDARAKVVVCMGCEAKRLKA